MNLPVQIINLGTDEAVPLAVNAKEISQDMPNVAITFIPEAWHFSFLGECTRIGATMVTAMGEDPICEERAGGDRSDIHAELKSLITAFLQKNL